MEFKLVKDDRARTKAHDVTGQTKTESLKELSRMDQGVWELGHKMRARFWALVNFHCTVKSQIQTRWERMKVNESLWGLAIAPNQEWTCFAIHLGCEQVNCFPFTSWYCIVDLWWGCKVLLSILSLYRQQLQEQAKLVVEENALLMEQQEIQDRKMKEMQRIHGQEGWYTVYYRSEGTTRPLRWPF